MRWLSLIPALLALHAASSMAASFSCAKASMPQEKAICASPELSQLDERLAAAYDALRKQLSSEGAARVQADEREWIKWLRVICPDLHSTPVPEIAACLQGEYTRRLTALQTGTRQLGGMLFFPRLKVLSIPEPPEPGSGDPGFGAGSFSWPEIDHPTAGQALWNAAMRAQAVRFSGNADQTPPHDFVPASVRYSRLDIGYTLDGANEQLIAATLLKYSYGYGAAHPNDFLLTFLWLPAKQRPLAAQDVFRPGSGWEEHMIRSSFQKLKPVADSDEGDFRQGAASVVSDVSTWRLDRDQLEISFPKYSVAAGAAGILAAALPWAELQPYLVEGFDPAVLPEHRRVP
jgi:uncharacterized protein